MKVLGHFLNIMLILVLEALKKMLERRKGRKRKKIKKYSFGEQCEKEQGKGNNRANLK